MTTWKKVLIGVVSAVIVGGLVALIFYLRGLNQPTPVPTIEPTPAPTPQLRALGNERFAPPARTETASNVDVGVVIVRVPDPTETSAAAAPRARTLIAQLAAPSPNTVPSVAPRTSPASTVPPAAAPTPTPLPPPPTFEPLPPAPAPQTRELAVFYAKGESQKRQIYMRSLDRDTDEQLVSDVFDDFGISFSSAQQKLAFYSNEEGPSDATRARSKLKVVDLATRKIQTLMGNLPGSWPVAWSPNGERLAIPNTNSIFISDVTTGTSLQVPTAKNPGAIVWAPGSLKFYFQAETSPGNHDIFQADGITGQASPVSSLEDNETLPSVSIDGQRIMFLKQTSEQRGGPAVVIKSVVSDEERIYEETAPAGSYLFNLTLNDLVFVQANKNPRIARFRSGTVQTIGDLTGPTLVSWDRDYQHVFVLADDDQGKALFSLDINTGLAEKIKAGISETVPNPVR